MLLLVLALGEISQSHLDFLAATGPLAFTDARVFHYKALSAAEEGKERGGQKKKKKILSIKPSALHFTNQIFEVMENTLCKDSTGVPTG